MTAYPATACLARSRRIVVKIGSALIVDPQQAVIREAWLHSICADIAALRQRNVEVLVVTSGAIALARRQLGLTAQRLRLEEKQALASIGQVGLAQSWHTALADHGLISAQLLLTPADTEDRKRHLNARATLQTLLGLGCIPVINENDAIATQAIRFGDNDRLAARVAQMVAADCLILLSDIDGLYTADPRRDPDARHLDIVPQLTEAVMAMGGAPPPGYSSGGMRTKLLAAQIATRSGANMIIAHGGAPHPLQRLLDGERCTLFRANTDPGSARKRWIASALASKGTLTVDPGALSALRKGASLLPAGVTDLEGDFQRGDLVRIRTQDGRVFGSGLIEYNAQESALLLGHQSAESETLLGYRGRDELIHRDNLILDDQAQRTDKLRTP